MLPNRMSLPRQTEERLRRLKQNTGISPNVSSRLAFFRSYEKGFVYDGTGIKADGSLVLDKVTWLGDTLPFVELLLKERYPDLKKKDIGLAWAAHVEDGATNFGSAKYVPDLIDLILL